MKKKIAGIFYTKINISLFQRLKLIVSFIFKNQMGHLSSFLTYLDSSVNIFFFRRL